MKINPNTVTNLSNFFLLYFTAIAQQQTLKALWFQYGGRKKYEEHLQWEMEKEALRQATAERDERNRKKREARERRRLLEKEKRLRLQTIAIQEIQRYVFSKKIYILCVHYIY